MLRDSPGNLGECTRRAVLLRKALQFLHIWLQEFLELDFDCLHPHPTRPHGNRIAMQFCREHRVLLGNTHSVKGCQVPDNLRTNKRYTNNERVGKERGSEIALRKADRERIGKDGHDRRDIRGSATRPLHAFVHTDPRGSRNVLLEQLLPPSIHSRATFAPLVTVTTRSYCC